MAIIIPNFPKSAATLITCSTNAADLKPAHGGPTQRFVRMGDRWSYDVELRPMRGDQAGRMVTALVQGLTQTVIAPVVQNGFDLTPYSNGLVAGAVSGGMALSHTGGGATKKVGQFFSIVQNGKRYLHLITAVTGQSLTFLPALRNPLAGGETLEFGAPKLEGFIVGREQGWTVSLIGSVGAKFRVEESL